MVERSRSLFGRGALERTSEQPTGRGTASHELVDHTSEVTLRIRAPDYSEVIAEATAALAELVPGALRGPRDEQVRELLIQAPDRVAGLVEWLNEVVYLCDAEQWLPTEVDVMGARDGELHIRAKGEALIAPFVLVKAATLHGAFVRQSADGLEAEITLDI